MTWLRRLVLYVVLHGPQLPFWLQLRAMNFILGSKGVEVPPAKPKPTVVTVEAPKNETDTEQWV